MTPLYDVLSMWPYFGDGPNQFRPRKAGLAMAVRSKNAHYLFHTIEALRIIPTEIQAWREANELAGRQLMRGGAWLE